MGLKPLKNYQTWSNISFFEKMYLFQIVLRLESQFKCKSKNNFINRTFHYSHLSNKRVGYNKRVGQKIHPTRSTSGQGGIFNLLHENQRVGWTFFLKRISGHVLLLERQEYFDPQIQFFSQNGKPKNSFVNMDIELAFNSDDLHQWNDKQILSFQNLK